VLLDDVAGGVALVPATTPLQRLNYFDGKFLRADDLNLEQRAQRSYVELSNRAAGPGVAYGFDLSFQGGFVQLAEVLAIDPNGRVLHLPHAVQVPWGKVLDAARHQATQPVPAGGGSVSFAPCETVAATAIAPAV